MRRTFAAVLVAAVLVLPATAAQAAPEDDAAELSQTIEVAWQMPGPFKGYATFPQTYLPGGVPECGSGGVQVDVYKYGTPEVRALVDALIAGGVLTSPADDARVAAGREHWFIGLDPCDPSTPIDNGPPTDNTPPTTTVDSGGGPGPSVTVLPAAGAAAAVVVVPRYAG